MRQWKRIGNLSVRTDSKGIVQRIKLSKFGFSSFYYMYILTSIKCFNCNKFFKPDDTIIIAYRFPSKSVRYLHYGCVSW